MKRLNIFIILEITTIVFCTFVSPNKTFFLAGNIIVYTPTQGTIKKSTNITNISKLECQLWREIYNFSIHFSPIGRAFSIFRQKIDGPNPSEMHIKVFIPALTFYLQATY